MKRSTLLSVSGSSSNNGTVDPSHGISIVLSPQIVMLNVSLGKHSSEAFIGICPKFDEVGPSSTERLQIAETDAGEMFIKNGPPNTVRFSCI